MTTDDLVIEQRADDVAALEQAVVIYRGMVQAALDELASTQSELTALRAHLHALRAELRRYCALQVS